MDERLVAALDQVDQRVQNVLSFLRSAERGEPIDPEALYGATHDMANVAASIRALRRLMRKAAGTATDSL